MSNFSYKRFQEFILKAVFLFITPAMLLGSLSCSKGDYPEKMESITIGTLPYEGSALIFIADDQQFFKANGLEVTIKDYETGLATTSALKKGEVDIAACAEFIIVGKAFQKEKILSIATIAKNLNEHIIAAGQGGVGTDLRQCAGSDHHTG
jgi:ABC-type nitrate/sulfonate/bicarbonate transport system substrate-binding protein